MHHGIRKIPTNWISLQQLTSFPSLILDGLRLFFLYVPRTNDDRSASSLVPLTAVSLSIKLPLFLEFFCFLPNRPPPDLFLPLEPDVAPPTQRKTMARKRHATAAHMKPKLYFPRLAAVPADLNALRPCTNAALYSVSDPHLNTKAACWV